MNRPRSLALGLAWVGVGMAVGIFIQHRWPLGRFRDTSQHPPSPAAVSVDTIAGLPRERRLVFLVAGQSNAANYGAIRAVGGARVYAFADGKLFEAADPLPGGDGNGGSIWSRLGARLAMTGRYDAVVFAVVAQGSSAVRDWAPEGRLHPALVNTLRQLEHAQLSADYLLWQQGETEAGWSSAAGSEYLQSLVAVQASARKVFPDITFMVAQATYNRNVPGNEQIRVAQLVLPEGMIAGPNLDQLDSAYRSDGVHFNDAGLSRAAELWFEALRGSLVKRRAAAP